MIPAIELELCLHYPYGTSDSGGQQASCHRRHKMDAVTILSHEIRIKPLAV